MKKISILLFFLCNLFSQISNAQYTNNIWCFGDSVGIDFGNHSVFQSGVKTKSGSSTICDSTGNLLFYCYGYDYYLEQQAYFRSGIVKNKNHQTMQNGDSLTAEWYHDITIIPKSTVDSTFYILCAGVSRDYGLYYSIVDLKQNNGLGAVVQKNIQLDTFPLFDGITAIKHGNGKDWWLIYQKWDGSTSILNNEFHILLIDSAGIQNQIIQNIGSSHNNSSGDLSFNATGNKMVYTEWKGLIELFDFDRFTGMISNPFNIEAEHAINPFPYYSSVVFSPNGRFLYVTSYQNIYNKASLLYQYDLSSPNITASRLLIDSFPAPITMNEMERGPDNKIYLSGYEEQYGYPYPTNLHTNVTDNLSVINYPDSLGSACNFQPFSFYLGGNRGAIGLPNNPDYTLGPLDTLTSVHEIKNTTQQPNILKIFYHPTWDIAFINADKLSGRKYTLNLFDITGKLIFKEEGNLTSQYFTKDLNMQSFAKGVYIGVLQTEKEKLSTKFVK